MPAQACKHAARPRVFQGREYGRKSWLFFTQNKGVCNQAQDFPALAAGKRPPRSPCDPHGASGPASQSARRRVSADCRTAAPVTLAAPDWFGGAGKHDHERSATLLAWLALYFCISVAANRYCRWLGVQQTICTNECSMEEPCTRASEGKGRWPAAKSPLLPRSTSRSEHERSAPHRHDDIGPRSRTSSGSFAASADIRDLLAG
jgi:hypothetical protein